MIDFDLGWTAFEPYGNRSNAIYRERKRVEYEVVRLVERIWWAGSVGWLLWGVFPRYLGSKLS
jgi:hypothetical protein